MICQSITSLIGVVCHPVDDDGSIAMLEVPFAFEDGEPLPVFVEHLGDTVRFFDDGGVIRHFLGRGVQFDDKRKTRFIASAGEPFGVKLTEAGHVETISSIQHAPLAFASFLSTLMSLSAWERDHQALSVDTTYFIEEVAMYLKAWKPDSELVEAPEFQGISGQHYRLDFGQDGKAFIATGMHHTAVNSALRKLLDIRSAPKNAGVELWVVLDDRADAKQAKKESLVLQTVATVLPFTQLASNAGASLVPQ